MTNGSEGEAPYRDPHPQIGRYRVCYAHWIARAETEGTTEGEKRAADLKAQWAKIEAWARNPTGLLALTMPSDARGRV